jgi:hypothetical protein
MSIEGEEVQAKCVGNTINKIIADNFPDHQKEMPNPVQEAPKTPNRHDKNRNCSWHIIVKTTSTEKKERIFEKKSNNM